MKITYKDSTITPSELDVDVLYNKVLEHMPALKDVVRRGEESISGSKSGVQMNATINDKGLLVVVKMAWFVPKKYVVAAKQLITRVVSEAKEETCIEQSCQ
jgi:hypothetical protein